MRIRGATFGELAKWVKAWRVRPTAAPAPAIESPAVSGRQLVFGDLSLAEALRSIELFAGRVMPELAGL
jgi:hypothetical protein